jgi:hypothetical protein
MACNQLKGHRNSFWDQLQNNSEQLVQAHPYGVVQFPSMVSAVTVATVEHLHESSTASSGFPCCKIINSGRTHSLLSVMISPLNKKFTGYVGKPVQMQTAGSGFLSLISI